MSVEKCASDIHNIVAIISIIFTIFSAGLAAVMQEQRCHVCVSPSSAGEVQQMFPGAALVPCHVSSEPRLCPPSYKGCLTQTGVKGAGGHLEKTMSCTLLSVDVCRVANSVEYCYCSGQLCNAPQLSTAATFTDDEDFVEGSGRGFESNFETTTTTTPTTTTTGNHTSSATLLSASLLTTLVLPLVCR